MDDYHLLDVQFQYQTKNRKLRWQIGGKNLLNVQQINALNAGGGVHSSGSSALIGTGSTVYTSIQWNIISKND
jgi:outer membrane receptor protein involved in Fe transport